VIRNNTIITQQIHNKVYINITQQFVHVMGEFRKPRHITQATTHISKYNWRTIGYFHEMVCKAQGA